MALVKYSKKRNNQVGPYVGSQKKKAMSVGEVARLVAEVGLGAVESGLASGAITLGRQAYDWWSSSAKGAITAPPLGPPVSYGRQTKGQGRFDGSITIKHRELVENVTTNSLRSYVINPANNALFPYLSSFAQLFDVYEFRAIKFEVVPNVGATTDGSYWMSLEPDAADANFALTKQQALAMRDSVSSPIWQCGEVLATKVSDYQTKKKMYIGSLATDDQFGKLYLQQDASKSIDLFVEYTVHLSMPQIGSVTNIAGMRWDGSGTSNFLTPGTPPNFDNPQGNAPFDPSINAQTFINWRPGYYIINCSFNGTTTGSTVLVGTGFTIMWTNSKFTSAGNQNQIGIQVTGTGVSSSVAFSINTTAVTSYKIQVTTISSSFANWAT